jgi:hypothetical protein
MLAAKAAQHLCDTVADIPSCPKLSQANQTATYNPVKTIATQRLTCANKSILVECSSYLRETRQERMTICLEARHLPRQL